jgi:hypothetical protein
MPSINIGAFEVSMIGKATQMAVIAKTCTIIRHRLAKIDWRWYLLGPRWLVPGAGAVGCSALAADPHVGLGRQTNGLNLGSLRY